MSTRLVAKNKRCEQGVTINQGGQAKRLLPSQPDDGLWRHYIVFYTASRYAVAHLDSAARSFGFGFTPRPREDPRRETNYYTNSCSPYVRRMWNSVHRGAYIQALVRIHLAGLIKEERGGCCGNRSSIIRERIDEKLGLVHRIRKKGLLIFICPNSILLSLTNSSEIRTMKKKKKNLLPFIPKSSSFPRNTRNNELVSGVPGSPVVRVRGAEARFQGERGQRRRKESAISRYRRYNNGRMGLSAEICPAFY